MLFFADKTVFLPFYFINYRPSWIIF